MSLPSLHGQGLGSPRSSTISSDRWPLKIIALRSSYVAGHSTGRAQGEALRPRMNFWTRLSLGSVIPIHGSERRGRRAKDWRSSSHIVGPCWFWTAWSRSKIRLVQKKDGYVSLPSRRFCASSLLSIWGFVSSPRGCRSLILPITSAPRPCAASSNNYPAIPERSCFEYWALKGTRRSCKLPPTHSLSTHLL